MYKEESDKKDTIALEPSIAYRPASERFTKLRAILGGTSALKSSLKSEHDLITLSRSGLPKKTLNTLAKKLGISMERLSALLHISHRTLQRKAPSDHLSVHVSEQILSIAEVIRRGLEVMGSQKNMELWLHSELPALDYKKPIDLMDTTFGTQIVLRILGRIEHGVY
jgi:putative toxin-antitoxin system antitoxin component (TIGR02293 family)